MAKKKDRGHIRSKVEKYIKKQKADRAKLYNAVSEVMPSMDVINGPYDWL